MLQLQREVAESRPLNAVAPVADLDVEGVQTVLWALQIMALEIPEVCKGILHARACSADSM